MISRWLQWFPELYSHMHMIMSKAGMRRETLLLMHICLSTKRKIVPRSPQKMSIQVPLARTGRISISKPSLKKTWYNDPIIVHPWWLGKGSISPHIWKNQSTVSLTLLASLFPSCEINFSSSAKTFWIPLGNYFLIWSPKTAPLLSHLTL